MREKARQISHLKAEDAELGTDDGQEEIEVEGIEEVDAPVASVGVPDAARAFLQFPALAAATS